MNREIQVHQVLHGYHNGHQLLASSIEFSFSDRRLLDSMSDGAGIDLTNCVEGYITGYALPESQKYVLAKTWYADDMQRPGCVWTHSLVFDIDCINQICSPETILQLYHRPSHGKYDVYTDNILINCKKNMHEADLDKLQYIIYTIYATDKCRYVEIEDDSYTRSLISAVCYMPRQLLAKFSFCSNSLINRCIDDMTFSYQMVMGENIYRVSSSIIESKLYRQKERVLGSPAWAREYAKAISLDKLSVIDVFMKIFSEHLQTFASFNQLLRLFFITRELDKQYSLYDYYDILQKLSKDNCNVYFECIISELIEGTYFDSLFLNNYMEMMDIIEKKHRKLKKKDKHKLVKKILLNKNENVPEFLSSYIHGTLGEQSANVAQEIIICAKPEDLKWISKMNHDIVVVAVAINNKLIMSPDLWSFPRDYLCDVINVLDESISYTEWTKILSFIIKECSEDISEAVYNKAQDKLVPALLKLFQDRVIMQYSEKLYIWDKYLLADQENLIYNLPQITQTSVRKHLLLKINTYNDKIRRALFSCNWIELFESCGFENDGKWQDIAIIILPLILESNQLIPYDMVAFVFGCIHQALAESQITYEDWNKIQSLLPAVDLCYAWDKCLQLRNAFENRGYDINRLFEIYNNIYVVD